MQAILTTNQIRLTSETPLKNSNQNVNVKNEAQDSMQREIKKQAAETPRQGKPKRFSVTYSWINPLTIPNSSMLWKNANLPPLQVRTE